MGDHNTAKTGQSRLKDYMAAREQDTQTLSPASTKGEQFSQILIDTAAKHVEVEKEGGVRSGILKVERALRARWQIMAAKPRRLNIARGAADPPTRSTKLGQWLERYLSPLL